MSTHAVVIAGLGLLVPLFSQPLACAGPLDPPPGPIVQTTPTFDRVVVGSLADPVEESNLLGVGGDSWIDGLLTVEGLSVRGDARVDGLLRIGGLSDGSGDLGLLAWASTNPSGPTSGDGFRVVRTNISGSRDYFVFEKTDGNDPVPDGGIAFARAGENGVRRLMLSMTGDGRVVIGDVADPTDRPGLLNVAGNGYFTGQVTAQTNLVAGGDAFVDGRLAINNGDPRYPLDVNGDARVRGTTFTNALDIIGGSDLSESFDASVPAEPGTVMSIDPDNPGMLTPSVAAYDTRVAGVVSGAGGINPGISLSQHGVMEGDTLVAMVGRVYVRATADGGAIRPGDRLTTSDLPGHAMRVNNNDRAPGAVIGKAMSSLDEGTGLVLVLVNLQ